MEQADFVHLARTSELACAENVRAYRRSVLLFAALGYLWVIGCLILAVGLLAFSIPKLLSGEIRVAWGLLALTSLGLLGTSFRALWIRFETPDGVRITAEEAPALFEALERIRKRIKGPQIHAVYLDDQFNASVRQLSRWGPFGRTVNQLTIGIPVLLALDKRRLLAVLAHEYGHLRGDHNRFSSWIYRTRLSWGRLYESMGESTSVAALMTQAFLRWYSPRFVAKTFALARQDEYEADRLAAKLLGNEEMVAALVEMEVKYDWLDSQFWVQHWAQAADQPTPMGPFKAMQKLMVLPPDPSFAKLSFYRAVQRISDVEDTHPMLRDRVTALTGQRPVLPRQWSQRGALALLEPSAARWLGHFDERWCRSHGEEWKRHHARLGRVRARLKVLQQNLPGLNPSQTVELANLTARVEPNAAVSAIYKQVLQRDPVHAEALIGVAQSLANKDPERSLQYLERLWSHHPAHRLWASRMAAEELESPRDGREFDAAALKLWRGRIREAEALEEDVDQEFAGMDVMKTAIAHDFSEFDIAELQATLAGERHVARAWALRVRLSTLPDRRAHVLLVVLKSGTEESLAMQVCDDLQAGLSLPGSIWVYRADELANIDQLNQLAQGPIFVRARL